MKKRIDLTGREYGSLAVLDKAVSQKKGRFWLCKCSCGKELSVKHADLRNGRITSCGHEEEPVKEQPAKKAAVQKTAAKKTSSGTGYVGVSKVELKSGTRYKANISVDGKKKHLGTFDTLEEAAAARKEAEEKYR